MAPRIRSYMTSPVYVVKPFDTLAHARNLMLKKGINRLVVVNEAERPIGVLTTTDLLEAMYGTSYYVPLDQIRISDVMTKDPITIKADKSVKAAAKLMLRHRIGGLPVVDDEGKLIGIITRHDLVRAFSERYTGKFRVDSAMRRDFAKALSTHSIYYVVKLMDSDPAKKVLVVEPDGKLLGVIAKRDVVMAQILRPLVEARGKDRFIRRKVVDEVKDKVIRVRTYLVPLAEDIMSSDVVTVSSEDDMAKSANLMVSERIGCTPVVDNEYRAIGLVTKLDIVGLLARL